ncbi:MAG TPA: glycosyltransferase [bacterium]
MQTDLLSSRSFNNHKRICFFAHVHDKKVLELVEFYHNDIRILTELGFDISIATRYHEIPLRCDLYYSWWWATGIQALAAARLAGKPIIMVGNVRFDQDAPYGFPKASILKMVCIKSALRLATVILTTSQYENDIVTRYRSRDVHMVYHGIDLDIYNPNKAGPREEILFTICNLYHENAKRKRIIETIEAFALIAQKFPAYKLVIAGGSAGIQDRTKETLLALVDHLNLRGRVVFTGSISLVEKIEFYRKAQAFVQPSVYEGFGLAIAEAMACGTPVVVCRSGATPEVVGDAGLYVSGTSQDIADGLVQLLRNKNLRQDLGTMGQTRVIQMFSYENRKKTLKKIIDSTLKKERS